MSKRIVVLAIVFGSFAVIMILIGVLFNKSVDTSITSNFDYSNCVDGKLFINGEECGVVKMDSDGEYAILPLIRMLEAMGYEVNWKNAHTATIKYDNQFYKLDTNKKTLYKVDEAKRNLIEQVVTGGHFYTYYQLTDDEFYISDDVGSLLWYEINCSVNIDSKELCVKIEQKFS